MRCGSELGFCCHIRTRLIVYGREKKGAAESTALLRPKLKRVNGSALESGGVVKRRYRYFLNRQ